MEPTPPRPDGKFATRAVHAATALPEVRERSLGGAIYPAATWEAAASRELGDLLDDSREGFVYGRYDNPTNTALHGQVASLHGADSAWALASGTAAIHAALDALRGGRGILATQRLYGGTWALLERLAERSGWVVDHVDVRDPGRVRDALGDAHGLVYAETIANPSTAVADIAALAEVAAQAEVPLLVDNTFASPVLCRPLELGAAAVVESATKYLGGHGDVVGGVVAGSAELVDAVREITYEFGAALGPFEAWLVGRGVQTLPLRMRQACDNALAVATALEGAGATVRYPGLGSHPDHALAARQFDGLGGGVLSVELPDRASAEGFADACTVFARAVSLGATRSLVLHPASTSHRQLDETALREAGLGPGTVRLSCGIEDADDLVADVTAALAAAT